MAANPGVPKPGTKYGPCVPSCVHRDCAQSRETAAAVCRLCQRAIGYVTPFYADHDAADRYIHADCAWTEAEQ